MHAMRVNIHTTLKSSPGALVFGRDMFLDVPLIADWTTIQQKVASIFHEMKATPFCPYMKLTTVTHNRPSYTKTVTQICP